ncbi:MAG: hypothetical protein HRU15_10115 [Planctomycetes bacterium]|nr:hypothetical protein [Planctomycetota bacterium]
MAHSISTTLTWLAAIALVLFTPLIHLLWIIPLCIACFVVSCFITAYRSSQRIISQAVPYYSGSLKDADILDVRDNY